MDIQLHTLTLDHDLLTRAAEFTRQVALLNRNHNNFGEPHRPIALVTDSLADIYAFRPDITVEPDDYPRRFVGTCWTGAKTQGPVIWLNPFTGWGSLRSHSKLVETVSHELAHAFTRGKHGFTFRRMYALISPHIYAAFDVDHQWEYVLDIVERYGRNHGTIRSNAGVSAEACWVHPRYRWNEEYAMHKQASLRMMTRLVRHSIHL